MDWKERNTHYMNTNGNTKLEIIAVILPSFFLTFIASTLSAYVRSNIFLEFFVIVFPSILNFTLYTPYTVELLFALTAVSVILCMFVMNSRVDLFSNSKKAVVKNLPYITNVRATINLITGIAILAVDFTIFPQRFSKTKTYGYSLMDLGVGLFIYSNGVVAPEITSRKSFSKIVKDASPLLMLGIARLLITKELRYHVPVVEYGVHWNFFITLFVVRIVASLIMNCVGSKYVLINAVSLLFAHEVLLQMGLAKYVFSNTDRVNFVDANREGIVSCLGYIGLYFLSVYVGRALNLKTERSISEKLKLFKKLIALSAILFFSTVYLQRSFGISRCLANTAYCIWVMFVGVFMTALFCMGEIVQQYMFEMKGYFRGRYSPQLLETINANGLAFFLICNLLTGLVNLCFSTIEIDDLPSLFIISLYMLTCCTLTDVLYAKGIKLKL